MPIGKRPDDCTPSQFEKVSSEGDLSTHVGVNVVSSRSLTKLNGPIPEFWKDKVLGAFITDVCDQFNDYLVFYSLVDILPSALTDLLTGNRYDLGKGIDALFHALYREPDCIGVLSDWPKYPHVIYLKPSLDHRPFNYLEEAQTVAANFRKIFNDQSVYLPHFLIDTILFPAISPSGVESGMVAVDLSRDVNEENRPHSFLLPKTVLDVVQYMAGFQILEDSNIRLKRLPFLAQPLGSYVSRIRENQESPITRANNSRRRLRRHGDISAAYEYTFLNDRIASSLERDSINQSTFALLKRLSNNMVFRAKQLKASHCIDSIITGGQSNITLRIVDDLVDNFSGKHAELKNTEEVLRLRETELADYLRDVALADSTRANLELQQSVWLLTKVAILFAFLSLVIAFLTDDNKKAIIRQIANWTRQVFR